MLFSDDVLTTEFS